MKEPIVISWSGGKDSAMALHELLRGGAYEVVSLLTTVSEEFRRISHHGVPESLLDEQAKAIGIPLRKAYLPSGPAGGCTNEVYESIMKEVMLAFRGDGVRTVAFGDLFLQDLREWREVKLAQVGMRAIFPIWNRMTGRFARDVIALGYKRFFHASKAISVWLSPAVSTTKSYCVIFRPQSILVVKMASSTRSFTMVQFFIAGCPSTSVKS
jgi:diphthamide synthase (EF-2-diphthine--ammonia ligase)